jgi:hypothetical protein
MLDLRQVLCGEGRRMMMQGERDVLVTQVPRCRRRLWLHPASENPLQKAHRFLLLAATPGDEGD